MELPLSYPLDSDNSDPSDSARLPPTPDKHTFRSLAPIPIPDSCLPPLLRKADNLHVPVQWVHGLYLSVCDVYAHWFSCDRKKFDERSIWVGAHHYFTIHS